MLTLMQLISFFKNDSESLDGLYYRLNEIEEDMNIAALYELSEELNDHYGIELNEIRLESLWGVIKRGTYHSAFYFDIK